MRDRPIPETAINQVAKYINEKNNNNFQIATAGIADNSETPQYFEIIHFKEIDNSDKNFYAIDGSYNSQEFYNGLAIGMYTAGYLCYKNGKQIRMNDIEDPVILGKAYYPKNILITNEEHKFAIYEELLVLEPVKTLIEFFGESANDIFTYKKDIICNNLSTLLSFCQEILEWALVYEIANLDNTKKGDYILRDGTLRSQQIKPEYLVKLGAFLKNKNLIIIAITKNSSIKMELSYTFRDIDNYLQKNLKTEYPFVQTNTDKQKLCCWFEVPDSVLLTSYSKKMYAKKDIKGGRGFGVFLAARLDYVEKLQNYDWVIVDVNIYDIIPDIEKGKNIRDIETIHNISKELTRLTQEHYILGYPYPLVEVHNFISLKKDFKEEIINRVKLSLYKEQRMDNIEIENLFLDIHDKF